LFITYCSTDLDVLNVVYQTTQGFYVVSSTYTVPFKSYGAGIIGLSVPKVLSKFYIIVNTRSYISAASAICWSDGTYYHSRSFQHP